MTLAQARAGGRSEALPVERESWSCAGTCDHLPPPTTCFFMIQADSGRLDGGGR